MSEEPHDGVVHQVCFGFSRQGMGPVADSGMSTGEKVSWSAAMEAHFRLYRSPVAESPEPASALSYFLLPNDTAAVLRRWRGAGATDEGRNTSHALFGPARSLTVPVALGLRNWDGWHESTPEAGVLRPLPAAHLRDIATPEQRRLRAEAVEHRNLLEQVLAQLVDKPRTRLTVLGVPDADRTALAWGVHHIGRHIVGARRSWSFSTYEISDSDLENLPEMVFVPSLTRGRVASQRVVVRADHRERVGAWADERAAVAVGRFVDGLDVVERRPEVEPAAFRALPAASSGPVMTPPAPVSTASAGSRPPAAVAGAPPMSGPPVSAPSAFAPSAFGPSVSRPPEPGQPAFGEPEAGPPASSPSAPLDQRPVAQAGGARRSSHPIVNATSERALLDQLEVLSSRATDRDERARIRRELGVTGLQSVAARIHTFSPTTQHESKALALLVRSAFGPALDDVDAGPRDGDDARAMAAELVETGEPVPLVRAMVTVAGRRAAPLVNRVAFRWFHEHQEPLDRADRDAIDHLSGPGFGARMLSSVRTRWPDTADRPPQKRRGEPAHRRVLLVVLGTAAFTTVMATLAAGAGLGVSLLSALVVGVSVGLVSFGLDRALVDQIIPGGAWQNTLVVLPRLALALLLGIVLAVPVQLHLAGSQIDAAIAAERQADAAEQQASLDRDPRFAAIPALEAEIAELETRAAGAEAPDVASDPAVQRAAATLTAAEAALAEAQTALQQEIDGGGGSGAEGDGPAAQQKQAARNARVAERDAAQQNLDRITAAAEARLADAASTTQQQAATALGAKQAELNALRQQRDDALAAARSGGTEDVGLLDRLQALKWVDDSGVLSAIGWVLVLLFTSIGILPVLVKLLAVRAGSRQGDDWRRSNGSRRSVDPSAAR